MKNILLGLMLLITFQHEAQTKPLEQQVKIKIENLEKLINKAEKKKLDVFKEKTSVATAKMFLKFAKWDEQNKEINTELFKTAAIYKKNASKMAEALPRFEKKDVIEILDHSIKEITKLLEGKITRQASVEIDWSKAEIEQDQIKFNGRPVFLADYIQKPQDTVLNKYYGNQDGFLISSSGLNEEGMIKEDLMESLANKPESTLGFVTFDHKNIPDWSLEEYGSEFKINKNTSTAYDIDHPGARKIQKNVLSEIVPYCAGKKFSKLGYMLCHEPNFYTQKTDASLGGVSGSVSKYTIDKFKIWVQGKHKTIEKLNALWKTNFVDFNEISIEIPIDTNLKGTPIWYDWCLFNMYRVTEWYEYLKLRIRKDDPEAKVHLKIKPSLWTDNERVHGIDLEALTNMSGIIGNDSGAEHIRIFGKPHPWEQNYIFEWRELCMGFDFMKSISPNKITFNTESHYLSKEKSKDLYLDPMYARASFWLAHVYGTTASYIWYWPREKNGSLTIEKAGKGYAGSNNQQPKVTNEVALTMIDLNANSEEIMSMQRQRKSIRIFYSKTSAINKKKHMDDVFDLYEKLNFNGVPIGFVTKDVLKNQDHSNWDVVLVRKTEFVTKEEMKALQDYVAEGGIIVLDDLSLKKDEYGQPINMILEPGRGKIISAKSLDVFNRKVSAILQLRNHFPQVAINEKNARNTKGCIWRTVKNKKGLDVLSVVNVGKSDAKLNITLNNSDKIKCRDVFTGVDKSTKPILKPYELYYVEITK